ncbi:MAG: Mpo1-like protein [Thermomicrobiales bacterium]
MRRHTPDDKKVRYSSLAEFYPFYLTEHSHPANRALHVAGTGSVIALAVGAIVTRKPLLLLGTPIVGYGFAWVGHFLFEHNRPATFKQPVLSLVSDFLMFRDVLMRCLPVQSPEPPIDRAAVDN